MRKKSTFSSYKMLRSKLFLVIIAISVIAIHCNDGTQDEPLLPENPTNIQKPANHNDPAILPPPTKLIVKYDGEFTPLISDIIANWRIYTALRFRSSWRQDCWSPAQNWYYNGVTRSNIKDQRITYQSCGSFPDDKSGVVDFSGNTDDPFWGQYKKGVEVFDSTGHDRTSGPSLYGWHYTGNTDNLVRYHRYYTIPDLPDAYIMLHRRWEYVQPKGGGEYAMCIGCTELEYESSITSGLNVEKTNEWGYTLGYEYTIGASIKFIDAAHKLSATIQKRFQTTISTYEEKTETIRYLGKALPGYNIIRCQVFREILTIKLVNQNGDDYYSGVFSPEIETSDNLQVYFWYYK